VKSYIEKLPRSAVAASFDPEAGLLKEAPAGQYFVIPTARESSLSIIIPSSPSLGSKQDYYNSYYELFNCENPVAGEVIILSPAVVEEVEGGWRLRETGSLEITPGPEAMAGSAIITCGNCGQSANAEHTFCKKCGARIKRGSSHERTEQFSTHLITPSGEQTTAVFAAPDDSQPHEVSAPVAGYTGLPTKIVVGFVSVIALIGIVLTIIAVSTKSNPDIEKKLDKAIATGQVFSPATDNAHDLYYQLKNSGATEEKLRPYRERLLPLLTDLNLRMIRDFMVPGSDDPPLSDWQNAYQSLHWAVELKPGDSSLQARTLYCEGRLAYLSKDEDRAIEVWTRAAEADKSWPLPINGIGLIYTARKNYQAARTYYFEAMRRDASWAYPYNNIGTSHYMEKNFYEAKDYYHKAVQLAPQWARPHSWLGDIAMKEKDYNTAIQEFSLVLDPSASGTKNMDLDKIRRQLELARQKAEAF
jgi:tetratricopeptide (TPR) repeat protein